MVKSQYPICISLLLSYTLRVTGAIDLTSEHLAPLYVDLEIKNIKVCDHNYDDLLIS